MKNIKRKGDWRKILDHLWYPTEEDIVGFKVFQMVTIPLSLLLIIVLYIFTKSGGWSILMWFWLFVAVILKIIASLRFRTLNSLKK